MPYGFSPPQLGQPRILPQVPQYFIPCGFSLLQNVHFTVLPQEDSAAIGINSFCGIPFFEVKLESPERQSQGIESRQT